MGFCLLFKVLHTQQMFEEERKDEKCNLKLPKMLSVYSTCLFLFVFSYFDKFEIVFCPNIHTKTWLYDRLLNFQNQLINKTLKTDFKAYEIFKKVNTPFTQTTKTSNCPIWITKNVYIFWTELHQNTHSDAFYYSSHCSS